MAYIVPSSPETLADRELYTRSRLVEVACLDCLVRVKVRKNSDHHTSIQWNQEAGDCATFAELSRREGGRPVHQACPRLLASIEAAVREGVVPIGAGVDPIETSDG
ncbi:hypothetical protein [Aeromicrobium terrae]|jgi:hypothetical protein|uniref:Ferredoxin n=1 Tax=Aeromicrobium terrae TaxID=2498846 RepID=A0A5C8NHZ7_9ACTN|nr:hypothetical protein [Aeromicrobium terrae]TXL60770.1 hypothetical protein FHP06_10120 [Aeromicrobium terrae]